MPEPSSRHINSGGNSRINRRCRVITRQRLQDGNYVWIRVGNHSIRSLIDTGSTVSIINQQLAHQLKLRPGPLQEGDLPVLFSANGSKINIEATVNLSMYFSGLIIQHPLKVASNIEHSVILGLDFLKQNNAVIDYRQGMLSLDDDLVRVPIESISTNRTCVITKQAVCIPALSEMIVPVKAPNFCANRTILLETIPNFQFRKCAVARSFSKCTGTDTVCQILNFNPFAVVLKKGTRVAKAECLNTVSAVEPYKTEGTEIQQTETISSEILESFLEEYGFDLNPELTKDQRYELLRLLYNFKSVFARDIKDIKPCKNYEMDIELLSNRKVFRRQYRLHPDDSLECQRQIDDMLCAGVIEESESADYNSPIFLVSKKNGSKRLVIDLRGLNSIIAPKLVQLPKINELIEQVTSSKPAFMSMCDLSSGFWQLSLTKRVRHLTSFTAPNGLRYQFCRAPFGLSVSPAGMLSALTNVFSGREKFPGIHLYMDDLLCTGSNWQDHLHNLKVMFENLQENNFSCNSTKCSFGYSEVEFLGYRISADSIRVSERKIKVIKTLEPPKNVKSLQRTLGIFNFWRRHIARFTQNTVHMRHLLTKGTPFLWTDKCQRELNYLKECLVSDPILRPFDANRDLIVCSDGSKTGLGYSLLQRGDEGELHVVAYGARALSPAQSRYTPAEIEAMSLALALRDYEVLAIHRNITVFTDNAQLLHFDKWKPMNNRQQRLVAYLSQFRLTIKYVKGVRNYVPDALSRLYQDIPEEERITLVPEPTKDDFIVSISTRSRTIQAPSDGGVTSTTPDALASRSPISTAATTAPVARSAAADDSSEGQTPDSDLPALPPITEAEYLADNEFCHMYQFLKTGQLSGDDKTDKLTLLLADQFVLDGEQMFRLPNPNKRKKRQMRLSIRRLCVPKRFRHEVLKFQHENCGHFGNSRTFLTLSGYVYWKTLYNDVYEFCKSCDVCLKSKRDYTHRVTPLHPQRVTERPFVCWALDHKTLSRKTSKGNVAILCMIDCFSNYPVLRAVPDTTAFTTAKVFIEAVVSHFGVPQNIQSDSGTAFTGAVFKEMTKILNIQHRVSAPIAPRTNGICENLVARVADMLKIYGKNDLEIEDQLPLMEMALRTTAHSRLGISPFEIVYGVPMRTARPAETSPSLPGSVSGDPLNYYFWLSKELKDIHENVQQRKMEVKETDKKQYDKSNKAKEPELSVGDKVLLLDRRVRAHSDKVLTHRPYVGPFFITDVVKGQHDIGQAYRLIDVNTGKMLRRLISADRLKRYSTDRTEFTARLPRLLPERDKPTTEATEVSRLSRPQQQLQHGFEPAKRILRERMRSGKREYLVLFTDSTRHWCDQVTPLLLQKFRLNQAKQRKARQRSRK